MRSSSRTACIAFDAPILDALYRNHGKYVSDVLRATDENLLSGYIVMEDAEATVFGAAHSEVGNP